MLLVENDADDAALVMHYLAQGGAVRVTHRESLAGVEALVGEHFDVVLLDLGLADSQGEETVRRMSELLPFTPIIILSGHEERRFEEQVLRMGISGYVVKSDLSVSFLLRAIHHVLVRSHLQRQQAEASRWNALGRVAVGIAGQCAGPMERLARELAILESVSSPDGRETPHAGASALAGARRELDGLRTLVASLQQLTGAQPRGVEFVDLDSMLRESCTAWRGRAEGAVRLSVDTGCGVRVAVDRTAFHRVISELLDNARESIPSGEDPTIWVSAEWHRGEARVAVRDAGRGVPKAQVASIFDPLTTRHAEVPGRGLGLTRARRNVESWGGRLVLHETSASGSRFDVVLPGVEAAPAAA